MQGPVELTVVGGCVMASPEKDGVGDISASFYIYDTFVNAGTGIVGRRGGNSDSGVCQVRLLFAHLYKIYLKIGVNLYK
jgi:hypothetical protein